MDVLAGLVLLMLISADVWRLWSQGHRRTSQDLTIRRRRGVPVGKSRVTLDVGSPVKGHPAQTHA
jgi:hypothetical protein